MANYSFGAPTRFYPRGSGSARRHPPCAGLSASAGASVAATFAACRCPQTEVFPPQSADPPPVTTAVTIATGAGLYAHAWRLSRLFSKKILGGISPVFYAFQDI